MKTLKQKLIDAGIPTQDYFTDLCCLSTPEAIAIIDKHIIECGIAINYSSYTENNTTIITLPNMNYDYFKIRQKHEAHRQARADKHEELIKRSNERS